MLDLKHIRTVPDNYHIDWLQAGDEIICANVMRKAWWGMKHRNCGDLLTPVRESEAKIKELEAKLEAAKQERTRKIEDVKLIAKTYGKCGKLYGEIKDKKDTKGTLDSLIDKVKSSGDGEKPSPPKPLMTGQLHAVTGGGNQQNGKQKNNNQNH